jgi:hypothetical protein
VAHGPAAHAMRSLPREASPRCSFAFISGVIPVKSPARASSQGRPPPTPLCLGLGIASPPFHRSLHPAPCPSRPRWPLPFSTPAVRPSNGRRKTEWVIEKVGANASLHLGWRWKIRDKMLKFIKRGENSQIKELRMPRVKF